MLALRKLAPTPGIALCDAPEPGAPGPGEVLLAIGAAGICGTDLHIADWTAGYEAMTAAMPVTLGHEFSGRVVAAGAGVSALAVGTRVVARPSVVCGVCASCRGGRSQDCMARTGMGVGCNGGFAAQVVAPAENCVAVPDGLDDALAALTEPMTVCAEAVDTAGVQPGDTVLVIGPGTIGQGIALFAQAAGAARVVIAGRDDAARLATLRALGFPDTVDTAGRSLSGALAAAGLPSRFDVVIEAAGVPALVPEALELLALRGVLTICGIHARPAMIDLTKLVRRHQQIRGSYRAPLETWPRVIAFLAADPQRMRLLISEAVPLADAVAAFARAKSRTASKIMLLP
ncbi:zinc-binding dehydrogenase [Bosea sp. (in: a-proteobacteria)]|uniref:zinc-dependent alcohol dehydrogenase n=1 Tax=Bosea sp. (in: a-proteobacteria) TaxID=1871050 RepID=UPI002732A460|nr:alcohol dehydrogenase catalytic domain-containing protein [Bosea sp. (in: a-proteobacteria)]MDP3408512.1 alcohol dehydrogenase catalytic domain-containing protein [Bosea sp. (in: a-proteobacteria)]